MSKRKRVAFLVPNLGGAGAERMMANLAIGFSKENFDVDLVLFKITGTYLEKIPSNINIVELNVKRALFSFVKIKKYLNENKPDAMISTLSRVNISAVIAKKLSKSSTQIILREANTFSVYTDSNQKFWEKVIFKAAKMFYPHADNLVGVSKGVADDLKNHFENVTNNKVSVIYNPVVDEEIFTKSKMEVTHPWYKEDIPIILGVGRITIQKDFQTLIRAFSIVRKTKKVRLIILGSGNTEEGGMPEEFERVKSLINELGISEDVSLPGFNPNPFAFMKNSSLFVLSSKWEGLPGVLIQALACGCPAVSTDCPSGPFEVLEDGKYGGLVPVGDYKKMAEKIITSLENPISSEVLVNRAKEFSIEKAVKNYANLIN